MDHADVLRRIKKLLQVTEERGASEAEAEQAARRVRALLDEHNLSLSQIPDEQAVLDVLEGPEISGSKVWERLMAHSVASLYDCRLLKAGRSFCFLGATLDVQVSHEVYVALRRQAASLTVAFGMRSGKSLRFDYQQGLALGLADRINTIIKERQAVPVVQALVVQKSHALEQYKQQHGIGSARPKKSTLSIRHYGALQAGQHDAQRLQIHKSVN